MKTLKLVITCFFVICLIQSCISSFTAKPREEWTTYEDPARWLKVYWRYDFDKQRSETPISYKSPEETYKTKTGVCHDSALFLVDAFKRIDPSRNPRLIWMMDLSQPRSRNSHHFTVFDKPDGLYFADFGVHVMGHIEHSGSPWGRVIGFHGPFKDMNAILNFYNAQQPDLKFNYYLTPDADAMLRRFEMRKKREEARKRKSGLE